MLIIISNYDNVSVLYCDKEYNVTEGGVINNAALKWVDMADSEPFVVWGFKRLYCVPDYTNDK